MEEKEELTPEEIGKNWKEIFEYFSNPKCKVKGCYGRGWTGTDIKTGRIIGCNGKKCSMFKLKRHELSERRKARIAKEKEKELKESEENNETTD